MPKPSPKSEAMSPPKSPPSGAAQRKLADFLCFSIYSANLAFGRAYKPLLDELGITYTQWIAIVALWEDERLTVKGLGEKLFLESNTLTPILKKLEELGYVRRQRDPKDERQVLVSLTDAGRDLRERGGRHTIARATGLSPEEFVKVQTAVARLRDNLVDHLGRGG
jgi:MarR family transcriptional regulator, organic hydroperoxide resistance regulator